MDVRVSRVVVLELHRQERSAHRVACEWTTALFLAHRFLQPPGTANTSTLWMLLSTNVLVRHGCRVERAPCTTRVTRSQPKRSNPVWHLATADKRRISSISDCGSDQLPDRGNAFSFWVNSYEPSVTQFACPTVCPRVNACRRLRTLV